MAEGEGRGGSGVAHRDGVVVSGPDGKFMSVYDALTDQEGVFVLAYLTNGGIATRAAAEAGYASPSTEGWRLLQRPRIQAALRTFQRRESVLLRAVAMATVKRLATDPGQPGDVAQRAADAAWRYADALDAAEEKANGRHDAGVPDSSGRGAKPPLMAELVALMAKIPVGGTAKQTQTIDMPT